MYSVYAELLATYSEIVAVMTTAAYWGKPSANQIVSNTGATSKANG